MADVTEYRVWAWFEEAWDRFKTFLLPAWLAVIVYYIVNTVATFLCYLPYLAIAGPMKAGLYVFLAKPVVGIREEVGDIFKGFRRFIPNLVVFLVIGFVTFAVTTSLFMPLVITDVIQEVRSEIWQDITTPAEVVLTVVLSLVCLVAVFLIQLFTMFVYPVIMFEQAAPFDALARSIRIVSDHFFTCVRLMVAGWVLLALATVVGFLLLCIGFIVTLPLGFAFFLLTHVLAYRDFVGLTEAHLQPYLPPQPAAG